MVVGSKVVVDYVMNCRMGGLLKSVLNPGDKSKLTRSQIDGTSNIHKEPVNLIENISIGVHLCGDAGGNLK